MRLVVKLSGKVLEDSTLRSSVSRQIAQLANGGTDLIVVHGGGRQLTDLCKRLAVPVVQYDGRRVTDEATLEVAKMVFSAINRDLTAALVAYRVRAVGVAAFDGTLTEARRRPPIVVGRNGNGDRKKVDFGLVGEITRVDTSLVESLWAQGCTPIVSCLCADTSGQMLNVNADTLAGELALALKVDRLVAVSDVDGIYRDPSDKSTLISSLTLDEAQKHLADGVFLDGMIPKVEAAVGVLEKGLSSFQVLSGLRESGLIKGLRTGAGTIIEAGHRRLTIDD